MTNKEIHIITGGTRFYLAPHLALSAPAGGKTGRKLYNMCHEIFGAEAPKMDVHLHSTKMAGGCALDTNNDVRTLVETLIASKLTKIIFFPVAMVDHVGKFPNIDTQGDGSRKNPVHPERLDSHRNLRLNISMAGKVIQRIRQERKDIFLVGFKQTHNATADEQYAAGLDLCKRASCNLVLANDSGTLLNMVVAPEEARYHVTDNRDDVLEGLVKMTKLRSHLTFTRSTVTKGEHVSWNSKLVPKSLRSVVNYCINRNAYKPFNGTTAGHFAVKLSDTEFLTSRRKTNFNDLDTNGLVKIETDGPDTIIAYGSKPSVGGQSQRIVFHDHREANLNCIVHFHCPIKAGSKVHQVSQYEFECGSHECGQNTSDGLRKYGNLYAVYLKEHGPNVVFNNKINPQEVIDFIEENFDLDGKTGGYVSGGLLYNQTQKRLQGKGDLNLVDWDEPYQTHGEE